MAVSIRELRARWPWGTRCAWLIFWTLWGTLHAHRVPVHAQPEPPEAELAALGAAVEQARFEDAEARARALLARTDLTARQRADALELLAVAQVARRDEAGARATLSDLFSRDPEHQERLRDPGPSVAAMFARAHAEAHPPFAVALTTTAVVIDPLGRALLQVTLGAGREAVDSVHVFARLVPELEQSHLVADVGLRDHLAIALPAPRAPAEPGASPPKLELYVEARAPSGAVIARDGGPDAPLIVQLDQPPPCPAAPVAPRPRAPWWLWTSLAIVVAGVSVSGALLAH